MTSAQNLDALTTAAQPTATSATTANKVPRENFSTALLLWLQVPPFILTGHVENEQAWRGRDVNFVRAEVPQAAPPTSSKTSQGSRPRHKRVRPLVNGPGPRIEGSDPPEVPWG